MSRWLSEAQLAQLPPAMTARALGGGAVKPKSAPARKVAAIQQAASPAPVASSARTPTSTERMQALGRLPTGEMNKTEQAYADHLEGLKRAGAVLWFKFESINLRLADATFYRPDFFVMTADRGLEVHEVKGHWTDDARVKIKVAAGMYPVFKFIAIKKLRKADGGGWSVEEF